MGANYLPFSILAQNLLIESLGKHHKKINHQTEKGANHV